MTYFVNDILTVIGDLANSIKITRSLSKVEIIVILNIIVKLGSIIKINKNMIIKNLSIFEETR